MLQFIRSKAGSFVVKLMFVALVGSFGIWGVGDFIRQLPGDSPIVKVGGEAIPRDQLKAAITQEAERMKSAAGGTLDHDQLKQFGVVDRAVDGVVTKALLDLEADKRHLVIGDDEIRAIVQSDPNFQTNGKFDKAVFDQLLQSHDLSEAEYAQSIAGDMPRRQLAYAVAGGVLPPGSLVGLLFSHRYERRVVDYTFIPASSIDAPAAPDDATLRAYYKANPALFTAPEFRGFTLLTLTKQDVLGSITISDDDLQNDYTQHLDDFTTQEQRDIEQILLPDQATAAKAEAALKAGTSFEDVATSIAHQDPAQLDLGWLQRKDMPVGLATQAFTTPVGAVTAPFQNQFGWTILRVAGDTPLKVKSFAEVRAQLLTEAKLDKADDALYDLSNRVEDAIAAGADIPAIAQQFGLKPVTIAEVDDTGKLPDGSPLPALPVATPDLLAGVFGTAVGQTSDLKQTKDGKFYIVRVDRTVAPVLRPFDAVADQVKTAWIADRQQTTLQNAAQALAAAARQRHSLAKAAAANGLTVQTTPAFARDIAPAQSPLPAALVSSAFGMAVGDTQTAVGSQNGVSGIFVAQLVGIAAADPSKQADMTVQFSREIAQSIGSEMLTEFSQDLRQSYPVTIDAVKLETLY